MGLLTRVGAAALVSLAAVSSVNAQGFYYKDLGVCGAQFNHQYLGCAPVLDNTGPFTFEPTNWDPASTADNSRSYINYDVGDSVNNTITPHYCAQTCRAHGFKYAAVFNERSCRCGSTLDYTTILGVSVTLSDKISATSESLCTTKKSLSPPDPCPGDRRENCGSDQGARIFVDPSFPDVRGINSLATSYNRLGCFKGAKFPSAVDYTTVTAQDGPTCLSYCGNLGLPYAFMIRKSPGVECHCGSEFNKDTAQADPGTTCDSKCSSSTDTTDCTGQDCCAIGGGPAPVYANVNFMGCFVPVIPGSTNPVTDHPAPNGYNCFQTPASILNRPTSVVAAYNTRTISRSASFVATASPSAIAQPFVNFGCWQSKQVSDIFTTFTVTTLASSAISVESCVAACDAAGQTFAALYGTATKCACASTLKPGVDTTNIMQDCNQPCGGSLSENCGGDNGPLIYARNDVTPNKWAVQWTSSRSNTITYSCAGGATTTTTAATTTTTASSTTTTTTTATGSTTTSSSGGSSTTSSTSGSGSSTTSGGSSTTSSGSSTTGSGSSTTGSGSSTTGSGSTTGGGSSTSSPGGSSGSSSGGSSTTSGGGSGSGSGTPTTITTPVSSGGATGSSSGSQSGGASPTGPAVPGITDLPADSYVLLEVAPYNPSKKLTARHQRRQSTLGFVGGAGPSNPKSCDQASLFGVRNGELLSGGQPIATDAGAEYIVFKVNPGASITRTFTIINGYLHWYSPQFVDNEAQFCQIADGTVYASFRGDNSGPTGCQRVDILVYYAGQCVDGQIISGPVTSGVPTGGNGGATGTGTGKPTGTATPGGDDDVPEADWVFKEGHAPDHYPCYETSETWIPGEPTFLPGRDEL
ncbi:hypothetical protein F5Y03DRAFT_229276 [Xylaria venustula]|nr:hypothetical protein F5Y03DRAFT_229276 [Xylaria venustula]